MSGRKNFVGKEKKCTGRNWEWGDQRKPKGWVTSELKAPL